MTIKINSQKIFNLSPPTLLAIGFLSFIIIGTLLLKLPIANKGNLSWMDALFTATSAVTITGLSVVNLNESFNHLGQVIILFSVHDKFHRALVLSGFFFLKIASTFLNSSFFPKPIKRRITI